MSTSLNPDPSIANNILDCIKIKQEDEEELMEECFIEMECVSYEIKHEELDIKDESSSDTIVDHTDAVNPNQTRRADRQKRKSKVVYAGGFAYTSSSTRGKWRYLRCRERYCWATGKVHADTNEMHFMPLREHNHPPDETAKQIDDFRKALKTASEQRPGRLREIYNELALKYPIEAKHLPFDVLRSSMSKSRAVTCPVAPSTYMDVHASLIDPVYNRFASTHHGRFYSTVVECDGGWALVFGNSEEIRKFFGNSDEMFIDVSFQNTPMQPPVHHLLTIFGTYRRQGFPLVVALMSNRLTKLYVAVLRHVSELVAPDWRPRYIMADCVATLYHAVKEVYPEANIHVSFFHYTQALTRKARQLGMLQQIQEHSEKQSRLRMYYSLALLPANQIEKGLGFLKKLDAADRFFKRLHLYVRRQWFELVGPKHWSMFGQPHRTSNFLEDYHGRLRRQVGTAYPEMWCLIEILLKNQGVAEREVRMVQEGQRVRCFHRSVLHQFDSRLKTAWQRLHDRIIDTEAFLRQSQQFTQTLQKRLYYWFPDESMEHPEDDFPTLRNRSLIKHPDKINFVSNARSTAVPAPLTAPVSSTAPVPSTASVPSTPSIPSTTSTSLTALVPSTAPISSFASFPSTASVPSTSSVPPTISAPLTTSVPSTALVPSTAPILSFASFPLTVPVPSTTSVPSTKSVPSTTSISSTTSIPSTASGLSTTPVPSTVPIPSTTSALLTASVPLTAPLSSTESSITPVPSTVSVVSSLAITSNVSVCTIPALVRQAPPVESFSVPPLAPLSRNSGPPILVPSHASISKVPVPPLAPIRRIPICRVTSCPIAQPKVRPQELEELPSTQVGIPQQFSAVTPSPPLSPNSSSSSSSSMDVPPSPPPPPKVRVFRPTYRVRSFRVLSVSPPPSTPQISTSPTANLSDCSSSSN